MGREQLAARRRELGLSQEQLAQALHVATGTYARWERGEATPLVGFRPRLAQRLEVSLGELDRWLSDNGVAPRDVHRRGHEWLTVYVGLEQSAASLYAYEPHYFHGLLQTSDYAHALAQESEHVQHGERVTQFVELRMNRQAALIREQVPLSLEVILAESALLTQVGGPEVMRAQLDHVVHLMRRPNVAVRILPFTAGAHAATRGPFAYMTFPWETDPSVVYLESYVGGASYIEAQPEIDRFVALYGRLHASTLTPDQSVDLIKRRAKELT